MGEPTVDLTVDPPMAMFAVRGLYRPGKMVMAMNEDHAKRQYHDEYPGWDGTVLTVEPIGMTFGTVSEASEANGDG